MEEKRDKVVIADDEPIIRINIGEILKQNGFDVCACVSNGYEAIKACQKFRPEVVLLDIKMPICDGVSAAKSIYMAKTAETIIMITAYSDISLVKKAVDARVDGYLVKPVDEGTLLPCICVARARSREMRRLHPNMEKAKQDMEARKLVERAKGKLMETKQWSEEVAYQYIRSTSKEYCVSMKEIAQMLLDQMEIIPDFRDKN